MRFSLVSIALVAALALVIAGCGKTAEQQKMETDLNAEVMALQKDVQSDVAGFADLQAKLDDAMKMHKDLMKKYAKKMKGHTMEDVAAAKQGLDAAKTEADAALNGLTAYDEKMDHEQAMAKLNQDKETLSKAKDKVVAALTAANAAISNHEKMKASLTAKPAKKQMAKAPAKKTAKKKTKK